MKKILIPLWVLLIIALPALFAAKTVNDQNQPDDSKVINITQKNPEKLEKAVANAQGNVTILIEAGTYNLQDTLLLNGKKDKITIAGQGKVDLLLDDVYKDVISIQNCGTVILSNIHAQHVKPLEEYQCHGVVVSAAECKEVIITRCELNGCGAIGISGYRCDKFTVNNCYIHNNSFNALYFNFVGGLIITHNVIKDNKSFAQFYDCINIEMWGNEDNNNTGYWEAMGE